MRSRVYAAFGRRCYVCGATSSQIDHVIPWSRGGPTVLSNLRPICTDCHNVKSSAEQKAGYQRREAKKRRPKERHPSEGPKPS